MESKVVAIKLLDAIEKCIDESVNIKWNGEMRLSFAKTAEHLAGAYGRLMGVGDGGN